MKITYLRCDVCTRNQGDHDAPWMHLFAEIDIPGGPLLSVDVDACPACVAEGEAAKKLTADLLLAAAKR